MTGPSHPRPHLVRSRWLSLDGTWSFALDPLDVGERDGWSHGGHAWSHHIEVPFPWESPRSGVGAPAPDAYFRGAPDGHGGIGWYRRVVELPADWLEDRIWLVVGAAYWHARVWVDARPAGDHEGGYEPFDLDVSDLRDTPERFELVMRVSAPDDTDEYPHGKNTRHWYSRSSGIWQSVFVEPRPVSHIARLRVVSAAASGSLEADVAVRTPDRGPMELRLEVMEQGKVLASRDCQAGAGEGASDERFHLGVPAPRPWTLDSPTLYDLRATLRSPDGKTDVVATTTGFRSISFETLEDGGPRWLHVNGEPVYVRAVMSQGYHPESGLACPNELAIRDDLEAAKGMGYNMVRFHVKVEDPRVLYWADRLGIMLWCEVPDFLTPSDDARARWEATWRAMLERDAGHPSIVMWCMFIESWGLGLNQFGFGGAERRFADDTESQAWVKQMYELGRSIDPTRPIIENSVCEADHTVAEINDIHLFPSGYGDLQAQAAGALEPWIAAAYPGSSHNFAPGHVQADQPLMVTSMAGWSSVDGVETSFPFRALVNEVRSRERIAGYGWVQLYDVEWELTGMLAYDRRPKSFGYDVREVNADDVLVVLGPLAMPGDGRGRWTVETGLAHSSGRIAGPLRLSAWLEGLDDAWRRVRTAAIVSSPQVVVERRGVIPLGLVAVPIPSSPFAGDLVIDALDDAGRRVATTRVHVATVPPTREASTLIELPLHRWTGPPGAFDDTVEVSGLVHRLASSSLGCDFTLPDTGDPLAPGDLHLLAEAAVVERAVVERALVAQTISDEPDLPVHVVLDGRIVAEVMLQRLRADSTGVLSIVHPEGLGTYGGPLRLAIESSERLAGGSHRLEIRPASPHPTSRVVLFGPMLGRAPLGPRLVRASMAPARGVGRGVGRGPRQASSRST